MTGWKTKVAAVAAMLTGAGLLIAGLLEGDGDQIKEGWTAIVGGLTILGIGHKIEKAAK